MTSRRGRTSRERRSAPASKATRGAAPARQGQASRPGQTGQASRPGQTGQQNQASRPGRGGGRAGPAAGIQPVIGADARAVSSASAPGRAISYLGELAAAWGPTAARVLLGLVLAWFGYHELVQPAIWTGYVPFVHKASTWSVLTVLAHGWVLLVLAVALIAGIMTRTAAAVAALLLAQIVIWLTLTAGLSDLTLRDAGVLGLALCLSGTTRQRLALAS